VLEFAFILESFVYNNTKDYYGHVNSE